MKMTPHQKHSSLKHLENAWEEINKIPTTTPCMACKKIESAGFCREWKEIVPKDVMEKGCDKWEFDPESPPF